MAAAVQVAMRNAGRVVVNVNMIRMPAAIDLQHYREAGPIYHGHRFGIEWFKINVFVFMQRECFRPY